jgi:hypothetical protein
MAMITAKFEGGPLDGTSKRVPDGPEYRYVDPRKGRYDPGMPAGAGREAEHVYRRDGAFRFVYQPADES